MQLRGVSIYSALGACVLVGLSPAPVLAACAGLSAGAISAKFSEAALSCGAATEGAVQAPPAAFVDTPRSVGIRYNVPARRASHYAHPRRGSTGSDTIVRVSQRYRIDPLLLHAIVAKESAYRPGAISSKGALGLMQVMPNTARSLGVRDPRMMLTDQELSLSTGASYLKQLQGRFGNDVPAVLAAYNAGPGAVQRYGRAVPYAETRNYVSTIMSRYRSARGGR